MDLTSNERARKVGTCQALVVEGLERGVNCAAIQDDMVSIVSTKKEKIAVEKAKAKARTPPPTTTQALYNIYFYIYFDIYLAH